MPTLTTAVSSGSYSAEWGGVALGEVAPGGFKLSYSHQARMVYFDSQGTNAADAIMTGLTMTIDFICMQPNMPGIRNLAWPFQVGVLGNTGRGVSSPAGRNIFDNAQELILTACNAEAGAAGQDPKRLNFAKTFLAPDFNVVMEHSGTAELTIPIRLMVLPTSGATSPVARPLPCGNKVWFTELLVA